MQLLSGWLQLNVPCQHVKQVDQASFASWVTTGTGLPLQSHLQLLLLLLAIKSQSRNLLAWQMVSVCAQCCQCTTNESEHHPLDTHL